MWPRRISGRDLDFKSRNLKLFVFAIDRQYYTHDKFIIILVRVGIRNSAENMDLCLEQTWPGKTFRLVCKSPSLPSRTLRIQSFRTSILIELFLVQTMAM